VNATEHENALVHFHFPMRYCRQMACARRDPARLQRAPKGAEQSTTGRGNHVVDCRGVRIGDVTLNPVMTRDWTVSAETNWFAFRWHLGKTQRPLHSSQRDRRPVNHIAHGSTYISFRE
jgi:hypothetical protein